MLTDKATIRARIIPVLKKARIKRAALFGSYARGEYTAESDVDVLVEYPEDSTLFDVARLRSDLEQASGKRVDLVSYGTIKPMLRESILGTAEALL